MGGGHRAGRPPRAARPALSPATSIDPAALPQLLARLHASHAPGDLVDVDLTPLGPWSLDDLTAGAGFRVRDERRRGRAPIEAGAVRLERLWTLPDYLASDLRLLVCGLNPSPLSADRGVGFARLGNRYWPAALAAGIVSRDRDAWDALLTHRIGHTDLVKRPTARADELVASEYRAGVERIERLCVRLAPRAVCLVGLSGWRAAVDRKATAGWQDRRLGGSPVYVMPSTSGLNAHSTVADLAGHLQAAAAGPT